MKNKKNKKSIVDTATYFYIKNIKKWMYCPSCKNGKMTFDKKKSRWICEDCGKLFLNSDATLYAECKDECHETAKDLLKKTGIVAAVIIAIGTILVASTSESNNKNTTYPPVPEDDDDEVYGLGNGKYPICNLCGTKMTEFDGWAWYTCPECENSVRIIDGVITWYSEIFGKGKKQHHSDFELADFCRGGDLTED